jgi:5-methyltetrahydropteroyltriglutamate--homocysteine methyltransferase
MRDMWMIGLDAPTYPQLRSFIEIYLDPLVDQGALYKVKDVFVASKELHEFLESKSFRVLEAEIAVKAVKSWKLGFKWLRAPVTGPFTLASRIYLREDLSGGVSSTALSRKDLVKGFFADYVGEAVEYMSNLGYNIVFLDEPSLTFIIGGRGLLFNYREEDIVDALEYAVRSAKGEVGIHVCGRLHHRLLEVIMEVPRIKYISVELHDTPQNLEVIDKSLLEKHDKILSPGVVSAKNPSVEDSEKVHSLLKAVYERTSGRIDLVSGDCGFRGLKGSIGDEEREYSIALSKLETIVRTVRKFTWSRGS